MPGPTMLQALAKHLLWWHPFGGTVRQVHSQWYCLWASWRMRTWPLWRRNLRPMSTFSTVAVPRTSWMQRWSLSTSNLSSGMLLKRGGRGWPKGMAHHFRMNGAFCWQTLSQAIMLCVKGAICSVTSLQIHSGSPQSSPLWQLAGWERGRTSYIKNIIHSHTYEHIFIDISICLSIYLSI